MDGLTAEDPSPGMAGMNNTFTVSGGEAGANLALLAGLAVGSTEVPGCPGLKLGLTSPVLLGTGSGDTFSFRPNDPQQLRRKDDPLAGRRPDELHGRKLNTFDIP